MRYFNPRSHERSDTSQAHQLMENVYFNPRSHERSDGTTFDWTNFGLISIHAPTRGATLLKFLGRIRIIFQSTLPREERPNCIACVVPYSQDFNPRSHERSDSFPTCFGHSFKISIHAPTRGATILIVKFVRGFLISIHAPTRGATPLC